jgi:hypothetical protein
MYRVINRAQWFTTGILFSSVALGFYIYGLPFISKVRFQWWVWTTELSDILKLGI